MARYEFGFIVTDTELSEELQQKVGQVGAVALVGFDACRCDHGTGWHRPVAGRRAAGRAPPGSRRGRCSTGRRAASWVVSRWHLGCISSQVTAGIRMVHQ